MILLCDPVAGLFAESHDVVITVNPPKILAFRSLEIRIVEVPAIKLEAAIDVFRLRFTACHQIVESSPTRPVPTQIVVSSTNGINGHEQNQQHRKDSIRHGWEGLRGSSGTGNWQARRYRTQRSQ